METTYRRQPARNDVILAALALPLYAAGVGRYGWRLLIALVLCLALGLATELIGARLRGKPSRPMGWLYWILLPLALPPMFPLWMTGVAVVFATIVGTVFFGGHGRQLAAPVAIGWAFAVLSFQTAYGFGWSLPFGTMDAGWRSYAASVLTIDTPVDLLTTYGDVSLRTLLTGAFPQTSGNAVPALTILCGLAALLLRAIDVRGCLAFVATTVVLTLACSRWLPGMSPPPENLLVGNFLLAAFWVLPDTRTSPRTLGGRWVTGVLAGVGAVAIRTFSSFPDGVFFAVLLANVFGPILDEAALSAKYAGRVPA